MPAHAQTRSDFKETYTVHAALRHALKANLFGKDPTARKAARLRFAGTAGSERSAAGSCTTRRHFGFGQRAARPP